MMENLEQDKWREMLNDNSDAVMIDVRTADEFLEGFIPNALNIDIFKGQGFIDEVAKLDKDKPYFLYCKAGSRSMQACQVMSQMGFDRTYNLIGGFSKWNGERES